MTEKELNARVELNEQESEDVDGGLIAELGLAAAMTFGQVAPTMQMAEMNPIVETGEVAQASTIEIKKENIKLDGDLVFNGQEQEQKVKITINGVVLVKDVEYKIKDNKATNAGTYKLTVEGIGNYSGKVEVEYKIAENNVPQPEPEPTPQPEPTPTPEPTPQPEPEPTPQPEPTPTPEPEPIPAKEIKREQITLTQQLVYNGQAQTQPVKVMDGEKELVENVDYVVEQTAQTNAGSYTLTVVGIGDYTGENSFEYTINPAALENVQIDGQLYYNGSPQTQSVNVSALGTTLKAGEDYVVNGARQQEVGTYTLTVEGTGNFTGKINQQFSIEKGQIQGAQVSLVNSLTENGNELTQQVSVSLNGTTLTEGKDFTVANNKATKAGTYTLTINGMGNYAGSVSQNFTVAPKALISIESATVTQSQALVYNGQAQSAQVTVTVGGKTLVKDKDFVVENNQATNAGTYTLTIKGIGDYQGTKVANFTIAKATLGDANVKLGAQLYANKKTQVQTIQVSANGVVLKENVDYEVTNNAATKEGTYTLTVKGKGNYEGQVNKQFTILSESAKKTVHTGEQTNVGLFAGLGVAALAGAGILSILLRKKRR